jgi:Rrf2 family protein
MIIAKSQKSKTPANKIAEILNASEDHLAKVLQRLVRAKIINSNRGPKGGFILARKPSEIFLIEIYEAIDGEMPVKNNCLFDKPACESSVCPLFGLLSKVNNEVKDYFSLKSLAELLK